MYVNRREIDLIKNKFYNIDKTFCQYRNCSKADKCDKYVTKKELKEFQSKKENEYTDIYFYLDQPECFTIDDE